eukprot:3451297-Prymnesium_polylepis.1
MVVVKALPSAAGLTVSLRLRVDSDTRAMNTSLLSGGSSPTTIDQRTRRRVRCGRSAPQSLTLQTEAVSPHPPRCEGRVVVESGDCAVQSLPGGVAG